MARIGKIPDTWTLKIHVIVLKDSRQAEHEEIGCINTTRRSSVDSNIKRGGRGAQNGKKCSKQQGTTRRSSVDSNIKRGGRGAQKETLETTEYDKTNLSGLKHQTWWERSSKRNARNNRIRQDEAQWTQTLNVVGEELKTERNARNNKARQDEAQWTQNIQRGGRGAQKETLETTEYDKTKLSVLEHQTWWERSSKTEVRRCPEERKIKRLNHQGQRASTYGSHKRPERN